MSGRTPRIAALVAMVALAGAAPARPARDSLDNLLAGKTAGPPRQCILPDFSATPRIFPGRGIVYFRGRTVYLARLRHNCPELTPSRRIIIPSTNGQLCTNDPVRILDSNGGSGFGFCTFEDFTPYTKAR